MILPGTVNIVRVVNGSSIFIITKTQIIEIKSELEYLEDPMSLNLPKQTKSLTIPNIFNIKHIDFIEIAGQENSVLIIGFKKPQTE
jgi:hypothetical protein